MRGIPITPLVWAAGAPVHATSCLPGYSLTPFGGCEPVASPIWPYLAVGGIALALVGGFVVIRRRKKTS